MNSYIVQISLRLEWFLLVRVNFVYLNLFEYKLLLGILSQPYNSQKNFQKSFLNM